MSIHRDIKAALDPHREEWAVFAERTAAGLGDSALCLTLFTKNYQRSIDGLLQFALAVMLDKPLYLLVPTGQPIPNQVRKLAAGIEYFDDTPESLDAATKRLLQLAQQQSHME